jgi:hypothetical protein
MNNQPDPTLAKAEIDLRNAEEAIERATKERDEIAAFIRRHKMYAALSSGVRQPQRGAKDETMAEALEAILSASNAAMSVSDILSALKARGRKMNSENPIANVSSILSRNKEQFQYEQGRGWTLRGS